MVPQGLDSELSTMQELAMALGELDPAARARVLHWLLERFTADPTPSTSTFRAAAPAPLHATVTALRAVPPPVSAADEQLSVGTLEDLFSPREAKPAPAAAPTITGMLTEFVAEFQNIAREWDDACAAPPENPRPARLLSAVS